MKDRSVVSTLALPHLPGPDTVNMIVDSFIFETPRFDGSTMQLKMAAKRYTDPNVQARNGLTILAFHGLGQRQYLPITITRCRRLTVSPRRRQGAMGAGTGETLRRAVAEVAQAAYPRGLGI